MTVTEKEDSMKYMLLIYQGDAPRPGREGEKNEQAVAAWESLSEDEQKRVFGEYQAINETPGVSPGVQLHPPAAAKTVRGQGGKTFTTDGPFAETKEALGGYLIFEADDIESALELAARIPSTPMGGAVEVRPIVEW
jgi:hypothetical protein